MGSIRQLNQHYWDPRRCLSRLTRAFASTGRNKARASSGRTCSASPPNRRPNSGYGTAAPLELVAADLAVLAKDKFTVPGVVAQAAAIASYAITKEQVSAVNMPCLVLHGDEDATVPFGWGEELAATIPGARFVSLKGAGHNFLVAAGEAPRKAILDSIAGADKVAFRSASA